jgi:DivIVA domain-containing protein
MEQRLRNALTHCHEDVSHSSLCAAADAPSGPARAPISGHTRAVATSEPLEPDETETEPSPGSLEEGRGSIDVPAEIRDVSFAVSLRGYDREEVDAYVARVNRLIAELDVSGAPEVAVRHALEQVGEQTRGLLQRAGETAEEITVRARQEAEESTARVKAEAVEIVAKANAEAEEILGRSKAEAETIAAQSREEAAERLQRSQDEVAAVEKAGEARMRELDADTETIRQQRRGLLDDLRGIAAQVAETASNADARFPARGSPASPEEETLDFEADTDTEGKESGVEAADEPQDGTADR